MTWKGTVKVIVSAEFEYEIDESWDAFDAAQAKAMVEEELSDYLGDPFRSRRFNETWVTEGKAT